MESSTATTSSTTESHGDENSFHILDGSTLGGGGQLLRTSVPYAALLRTSLRIFNIRIERSSPGLRMQHLKGIQLISELCNGDLDGDQVSSKTLSFIPRALRSSGVDLFVDIQTAGSITLVILAILPVLLFQPPTSSSSTLSKPSTVTLIGGTNAPYAPQIDYFLHVFLPVAEKMFGTGRVRATVFRRGYFPRGGGEVRLEVTPLAPGESLAAVDLTVRSDVTKISGYVFAGGVHPPSIAWEIHTHVVDDLEHAATDTSPKNSFPKSGLDRDLEVVQESKASGGGNGLLLWAETETGCVIAGSSLGDHREKKSNPKSVAKEATSMLVENLATQVCVDEFLQDQLIIFMALAKGRSRVLTGPITLHTKTVIWVAMQLTGVAFDVQELDDGRRTMISCEGLGFAYDFSL